MGYYDFNCRSGWIGAIVVMAIGRSQMSRQISKPPRKRKEGKKLATKKTTKKPKSKSKKSSTPTNPSLYARVKAEAKRKFDVYPSAYANAWLVRTYKKRGGGYR